MGIVYCGPLAAEINQGTRYGHEGYAAQVLADGAESGHWVREFREYRAGCGCGWRSTRVHPPTDAGKNAAEDEWNDEHLQPLIRAVVAGRVVVVAVLLDLLAELRRTSAPDGVTRPNGQLTEREAGRFDVIETLESRLEDIAVERAQRSGGGAW